MAKYRRYRRYRRRSGKWAANLQEINTTTIQAPNSSQFYWTYTLAFNPTQVNTSVSQVFTVKNLEVNFYIDTENDSSAKIEDVCAYIMFVPQGMTVGLDYNLNHPEYIMAYKYLGSPTFEATSHSNARQEYQPSRIKTRLSRKLQSGDNVVLLLKGSNLGSVDSTFDIHGLLRWWTKAN